MKQVWVVLLSVLTLSACAYQRLPYPRAVYGPDMEQTKLQSASHWDLLAKNESEFIAQALPSYATVHVVPAEDASTPFHRAYHDLLLSSLVKDGATVMLDDSDAIYQVEYRVETVTHHAMNRQGLRLCVAGLILLLSACASVDNSMMDENHRAARSLIRSAGSSLSPSSTMIAATLANIDDLSTSSSFGRVASQQIVSGFTNRGYNVVDILLRNNIYVDEAEGEFLLSREIANIRADYQADVVLAGTYAVGNRQVFVTAKLIRTADGMILSSHDYAIPFEGEARALITGEQTDDPGLLERLFGL